MNKKNKLNMALLIIGISMVILGVILYFTVPLERGEWTSPLDRGYFTGVHGFDRYRSPGGIWFFPLVIIGLILIIGFRKRHGSYYSRPGRHFNEGNPMNILRRSYA